MLRRSLFVIFLALGCVQAQRLAESQSDPESEFFVVETPSGPGLRFPVIHMHAASRCYGHLTLGAEQIQYQVVSGDASHSFLRSRSEFRGATPPPPLLGLGARFKWNGGGDHVFVPVQEKSLNDRNAFKVRSQGRNEKNLLLAANNFQTAMAQLGGGTITASTATQSPAAVGSVTGSRSAGGEPAQAAVVLAARTTEAPSSGLYELERELTFNVLDGAYFDAASGQISLFGHRDPKRLGPKVPYLQHLAALLENPRPEFTLNWTPESERRVKAFMNRAESPEEARRLAKDWGTMSNAASGDYRLTPQAKFLFRGLNVMPSYAGSEKPGYFGAEIRDTPDAFGVVVTKVDPNGPAAKAGVRVGDKITQAGVYGNVPITTEEFVRLVRLMGAGAEFNFVVEGRSWQKARLDAAIGELWDSITTTDFTPMLWRAAGKEAAAEIIESFYTHVRVIKRYPDMGEHGKRAYFETLYKTGLYNEFDRLHREVYARRMSSAEAERILDRQTCAVLERKMGLPAGSMTSRFDALIAQRKTVPDAYHDACLAPDNFLPVTLDALRIVWQKAGAIQIAPEMFDRSFNVRPEVVPEFRGVRSDTLLARAMMEGDYIGKRMMDMPWLERKIPRYKTGYRFMQQNPRFDRARGTYHMWISVARMDAVQSPDKSTLEIRDARMRFNIREYGADGRDLPPEPGGYEELLTSLYDELSSEFPVLYELREAAKLAAIADWVRAKRPDFRLPAEGMSKWSAPAKLPGLMYIYAHMPDPGARTATVATIATGGVALEPWVWSGKANLDPDSLPVDANVVDLRDLKVGSVSSSASPRSAVEIPRYDNQAMARVLKKPAEPPFPYPPGHIGRAQRAGRILQVVSVLKNQIGKPGCNGVAFAEKLQTLEKLQEKLAKVEEILNEANAGNARAVAKLETLEMELRQDSQEFQDKALDSAADLLFGMHNELKNGTLKQTAEGVEELRRLTDSFEERKNRIQNLTGTDAQRIAEMREMMKGWVKELAEIEGTAAYKYLGPVMKKLNAYAQFKDIAELYYGFSKLFVVSEWRVDQAASEQEKFDRIQKSILPLHRRVNDQVTALQRDPVITACTEPLSR